MTTDTTTITKGAAMSYEVDFVDVSTVGLESSPVADALAGLRANEARYFKNKYDHTFTVEPAAAEAKKAIAWAHKILEEERGSCSPRRPLEATTIEVEDIKWVYVFYENGLSINVLYPPTTREARRGLQAVGGDGGPRGAEQLQVRPPEVEAGRHDPRLVLRHQGRVLATPPPHATASRRWPTRWTTLRTASGRMSWSTATVTAGDRFPAPFSSWTPSQMSASRSVTVSSSRLSSR